MIKNLLFTSLFLLLTSNLFAQQETDSLILKSINFLEKTLHLNFEIENKYILVNDAGKTYVVDKYIQNKKKITNAYIVYDLKKESENKYSFTLKLVSILKGSFEAIKEGDSYQFVNLSVVQRSPPLISVPMR